MVTDQQFREALKKIEELESKVNALSRSLAEMKMKSFGIKSTAQQIEPEARKDTTHYLFNGIQYNKRNFVLACVKQYIKDNIITSFTQLSQAFPDHIQGSLGVIKNSSEAEKYMNADSRFFFKDDDVIVLQEGTFVVCKEWSRKNIDKFLKAIDQLGYSYSVIERT